MNSCLNMTYGWVIIQRHSESSRVFGQHRQQHNRWIEQANVMWCDENIITWCLNIRSKDYFSGSLREKTWSLIITVAVELSFIGQLPLQQIKSEKWIKFLALWVLIKTIYQLFKLRLELSSPPHQPNSLLVKLSVTSVSGIINVCPSYGQKHRRKNIDIQASYIPTRLSRKEWEKLSYLIFKTVFNL